MGMKKKKRERTKENRMENLVASLHEIASANVFSFNA
jgi:hypothetical protein